MPIPLAAIGVAVATAVANCTILLLGKSKIKREQESYDSRLREFRSFEKHYRRKIKKLEARFEVLGKRKLQSLNTMKLAVDFIKKARIRDRDLNYLLQITQQKIEVWEGVTVQATEMIGGLTKSLGAGTATGVAIYSAVGA
ncbi:MAG: hypothetical protein OXG98_19045, partial [Gemmatimonadetes bacterium]|nr:hypothetical protein [Gemmatimonadota bacterium]